MPEGFELVEGRPPRNATRFQEWSIQEKLKILYLQQPVAVRVQFYTLKAAVKNAFEDNDIEAAQEIIRSTQVSGPLAALKAQMLGIFEEA
ncbi:MAG: hypothetical protein KTR14_08055 [Vampirovibrio sp.]|nr:hypothetical protein [Vampirovibrio sp.]